MRVIVYIAGALFASITVTAILLTFSWYYIYGQQDDATVIALNIFLAVCLAAIVGLWLFRPLPLAVTGLTLASLLVPAMWELFPADPSQFVLHRLPAAALAGALAWMATMFLRTARAS